MRHKYTVAWFTVCLIVGVSFAFALIGPRNIDRSQDYTWSGTQSFTGTVDLNITSFPLSNDEQITNDTDGEVGIVADDDAVELLQLKRQSSNTSTEDANYFRDTWVYSDSNAQEVEGAYLDMYIDDVTSTTLDTHFEWAVQTNTSNTTPTVELNLTGAALYPEADEGLDLGTSSAEFKDAYIDGTAYVDAIDLAGTAITSTAAEINLLDGLDIIQAGTVDVNNGQTTGTVTVTGLDTGDVCLISPAEDPGSATWWHAVPTANTLTVTVSGDPGTTVTFNYLALGLE